MRLLFAVKKAPLREQSLKRVLTNPEESFIIKA